MPFFKHDICWPPVTPDEFAGQINFWHTNPNGQGSIHNKKNLLFLAKMLLKEGWIPSCPSHFPCPVRHKSKLKLWKKLDYESVFFTMIHLIIKLQKKRAKCLRYFFSGQIIAIGNINYEKIVLSCTVHHKLSIGYCTFQL